MPATALWIASKASLLNLRVAVFANLHQFLDRQFFLDLHIRFRGVEVGQFAKRLRLVLVDIRRVLLCEKLGVDPVRRPLNTPPPRSSA